MQVYFGEQTHLDQANAIMDSNLEEAWGETKKHPEEWEWKSKYSVCFFAKHSWTHGKPLRLATRSHTCNFPARPVGYIIRVLIGSLQCLFVLWLAEDIPFDWFYDTRLKTAVLPKMIGLKRFALCSHLAQSEKKTKPHVIHSSFFLCFALTSSYDWFRSLRIVRVLQ